jgi:hypothetical protein
MFLYTKKKIMNERGRVDWLIFLKMMVEEPNFLIKKI